MSDDDFDPIDGIPDPDDDEVMPNDFQQVYLMTLQYREPVAIDGDALLARVQQYLPETVAHSQGAAAKAHIFACVHAENSQEYADGKKLPGMFFYTVTSPDDGQTTIDPERYASLAQQTWDYPGELPDPSEFRYQGLATEMMCGGLPYADRIRLFQGCLRAILELYPPDLILCPHTQQIQHPAQLLERLTRDEPDPYAGFVNVRFYSVQDSDDMLMDTVGLGALGLPDIQCHFTGLDPNDVGKVIWNLSYYLLENGPVIESGDTIDGVGEDAKWDCRFELALVEPERVVLDLDPGAPHAAGGRS